MQTRTAPVQDPNVMTLQAEIDEEQARIEELMAQIDDAQRPAETSEQSIETASNDKPAPLNRSLTSSNLKQLQQVHSDEDDALLLGSNNKRPLEVEIASQTDLPGQVETDLSSSRSASHSASSGFTSLTHSSIGSRDDDDEPLLPPPPMTYKDEFKANGRGLFQSPSFDLGRFSEEARRLSTEKSEEEKVKETASIAENDSSSSVLSDSVAVVVAAWPQRKPKKGRQVKITREAAEQAAQAIKAAEAEQAAQAVKAEAKQAAPEIKIAAKEEIAPEKKNEVKREETLAEKVARAERPNAQAYAASERSQMEYVRTEPKSQPNNVGLTFRVKAKPGSVKEKVINFLDGVQEIENGKVSLSYFYNGILKIQSGEKARVLARKESRELTEDDLCDLAEQESRALADLMDDRYEMRDRGFASIVYSPHYKEMVSAAKTLHKQMEQDQKKRVELLEKLNNAENKDQQQTKNELRDGKESASAKVEVLKFLYLIRDMSNDHAKFLYFQSGIQRFDLKHLYELANTMTMANEMRNLGLSSILNLSKYKEMAHAAKMALTNSIAPYCEGTKVMLNPEDFDRYKAIMDRRTGWKIGRLFQPVTPSSTLFSMRYERGSRSSHLHPDLQAGQYSRVSR